MRRCLLEGTKKDFRCFQHCLPVMVTKTGCWRALPYSWIYLWSLLDHLSVHFQDSTQALGGKGSPGWTSSSWEIPAPLDPLPLQFPVGTKVLQGQCMEEVKEAIKLIKK